MAIKKRSLGKIYGLLCNPARRSWMATKRTNAVSILQKVVTAGWKQLKSKK